MKSIRATGPASSRPDPRPAIRFRILARLLPLILAALLPLAGRSAGTWSPLANQAPGGVALMLLLSDGTVMCQNSGNVGWYRLTPDIHGSYVNGTWTTLASMHDSRRYYGSQVMRDGRVYVAGGEYGTGAHLMEIYDPINNSWTQPVAVPNSPIDSCTETLPNGNILQGNAGSDTRVYDVPSGTYSVAITALGGQDEPSWVKLQDGSLLTLTGTTSERFIPALNKWVADADLPTTLFGYGYEIGAALLLPNGKVFYIGGTNHTAIYTPWTTNYAGVYTPAGATNMGTWVAGPDIPNTLAAVDAPAAMLNNGNVLCALGTNNGFGSITYFYEYNYVSNSFTQVASPTGGLTDNLSPYGTTMLDLPDGTVLYSGHGAQIYSYKPGGSPLTNGMPTILSVVTNLDGTYHVSGTLLNGISEGAAYGDDSQMNSDYPVARITNSGNTAYCRTFNWSTCNLMTGTNIVSTEMALPPGLLAGTYPLVVTANGIASAPYSLTILGTPLPVVTGMTFTNLAASQMALRWNAIGLTETGYVVQRSTNGSTFTTVASLAGTMTSYVDNSVTPLGQYYYRVLGTNSVGLGLPPQPIFAASPPVIAVPAPWITKDIGAVGGSGASGSNAATFTVIGSGAGIGGTVDQFQFLGQPIAGDVTITARILTNQPASGGSLAAVMLRNSLDPAAAGAVMGFNGVNLTSQFQSRANAGDLAATANGSGSLSLPYWVRLVRTGNSIAGYTSPDGIAWTSQGTATVAMESVIYAGLAVSSGTNTLLNTSQFDNVSIVGTSSAIPIPIADWKLDETSGSIAQDSRGNFDGTYNNVVLGLPGATPVSGYAAGFNGTSANIAVPPLNLNSNVLTITAWLNRNGNQNQYSGIFFHRGSTADGFHFGTANELRYTWNNSASTYGVSSGLVPPAGVWTFVALVIEPTRARIFMATNGVLLSWTNNVANPAQAFDATAYIGQDSSSSARYFNGQLDEVQLYNQALTPTQLSQMVATPSIAITAPANGQEFLPPATINLTATPASMNGHVINLVQLFNNGNLVSQAAIPPFTNTVTNLPAGTYSFTARMFYDSGLVVSANPATVIVESAPAVPQRLSATALASNLVYVSWQPAAGADGYMLNQNGTAIAITGAPTNYFVSTGLVAGSNYCYTVVATNQVGSSAASASACATTPASATSLTWDANSSPTVAQDGSGSWDGVSSTWWNGSANTIWTDGVLAVFGSNTPTNCSVSVTANFTPAGLLFNTTAGGNYTLANGGGSIILTNGSGFTVNSSATIGALITGSANLVKAGPGYLLLNNTNTFTGGVIVNRGTVEMASKSGDVTYVVTNGATLKIGYSTGGGYAGTSMKVYGDGAAATTGLYLAGGTTYNVNGGLILNSAATTIRQYGTGLASIGMFDINVNPGLSNTVAASGSVIDANIQMISDGYGMVVGTAAGANTASGDLVINGPLNVGNLGFYKRGGGSVLLNGVASVGNLAFQLQAGSVFCGTDNCLGQYAVLTASAGTTLDLKTTAQTLASATLAGTLRMGLNKTNALPNAQITCLGGTMTLGGTLIVTNVGTIPLAAGDSFTLLNANTFSGNFTTKTLPTLSAGLFWNTAQLTNNGVISVVAAPAVTVSPATTNFLYGNSVTLSAVATGTAPLSYQWYDYRTNVMAGQTNPFLTLASPAVGVSGKYTVTVTNAYGKATNFSTVTIGKATLTITANNVAKAAGQNFTFAGTEFFSAGLMNSDSVTSATLASLGATNTAAAGSYAITITNALGSGLTNYTISYVNGTLSVTNPTVVIPVLTSAGMGASGFSITGTGAAGRPYVLLSETNLAAAVWVPIATNTADGSGGFQFTDTGATNTQQFYRILAQ